MQGRLLLLLLLLLLIGSDVNGQKEMSVLNMIKTRFTILPLGVSKWFQVELG